MIYTMINTYFLKFKESPEPDLQTIMCHIRLAVFHLGHRCCGYYFLDIIGYLYSEKKLIFIT